MAFLEKKNVNTMAPDVNLKLVANMIDGYSGSDKEEAMYPLCWAAFCSVLDIMEEMMWTNSIVKP
jgi:hypothetical protein